MEYYTSISVCPQKLEVLGMPVEKMIAGGMRLQYNGKVKGKFHYVKGYTGFSKSAENQDGYFLPIVINTKGEKLTIFKNGEQAKENPELAKDNQLVMKVTPAVVYELKVDGQSIAVLDFSEAVFEEEKEENKMNVTFFDPGSCGVYTTGHIAHLDKNTKTADAPLVLENVFPKGAYLIDFIVKSSDDMAGPSTIGIGINEKDPKEYGSATATQGQIVKTEVEGFKQAIGSTVRVKADSDVTEGTVDVFATIIRLEV